MSVVTSDAIHPDGRRLGVGRGAPKERSVATAYPQPPAVAANAGIIPSS